MKYVILLCMLAMVVIAGCSSAETTSVDASGTDVAVESDSSVNIEKLSDEERYVYFETELACALAEAGLADDGEAVLAVFGRVEEFATKYGFTSEEVTSLGAQYSEDAAFASLVEEKMAELCPDVLAQIKAAS